MSLSIIQKMNEMLLTEMPEYRAQAAEIGVSGEQQWRLLRALMNVRPARLMRVLPSMLRAADCVLIGAGAACAADGDPLVFASDRFSCPMRVPMLYYFLYHDVHKNNNNKL